MFLVFRFRTSIVILVRPQTNINVLINDFSQVVFDFFFLFTSILICRTYSSDFFKLRFIENYISTFGNLKKKKFHILAISITSLLVPRLLSIPEIP